MSNKVENAISELSSEWAKFKDHHVGMIAENRARLETLEARKHLHGAGNGDHFDKRATDEYLRDVIERKAVTVGSATGGGNAQPEILSREVWSQIPRFSPIVDLVNVETAQSADFHKIVTDLGHGAGWVAEGGTRSETDTALMQRVSPTFGTVYSYPKVSEEALQDIFFNVTDWFLDECSKQFAVSIGEAIINGSGTARPTGFLQATTSSTPDFGASPVRPFGHVEYVPTGSASGFLDRLSSPLGTTSDAIFDCFYALNSAHRANATWIMNSATFAAVRKLKDADGDYIWQRGFGTAGEILGRPVVVCEGMPDIGANTYPIACADWRAAYCFVRVGDSFRVTWDDNITTPGQVRLYCRERIGGKLLDDKAIKLIKVATS
jgi:HK97 family phage major capsid protein